MRITVNSPDGIGDFIMRLPFLQALLAEGHHLQLLLRKSTVEFAAGLFPEAEVHVFVDDPYNQELKKQRRPFQSDMRSVRRFKPDLYVASAFFLTFFDEEWMTQSGSSVPLAGFEAQEERWGSNTIVEPIALSQRFAIRIPVPTTMPEVQKYQRMADAIVGRPLQLAQPRQPSGNTLQAAGDVMARNGLEREGYFVACAGTRHGQRFKDWGEQNWAAFFSEVATASRKPIVFLGNREESASVERIRSAMPAGTIHINLAEEPPPILISYALVAQSAGYLGRDSGVMHMAAATDRPLLALFSGVHWPRFVPAAAKGLILSQTAPCRGCNRHCPFPEAYCITRIPLEGAIREWHQWDKAQGTKIVEFPQDQTFAEALAGVDAVAAAWSSQMAKRRREQDARPRGWGQTLIDLVRR